MFILACLNCLGTELKRDVTVVLCKDPDITTNQVYLNLRNYYEIVFIDKEYLITRPHTNGTMKERYFIIFMERRYFY